jgi:hypothetical protein
MNSAIAWTLAASTLSSAGAAAQTQSEALGRFAGSFIGSGTVVEGPNATAHKVTCDSAVKPDGNQALTVRGICRAYLVFSRAISADLTLDPGTGRLSGTYTGSRVGTARLSGRLTGRAMDLAIRWPKPLYGDTRADMRIVSVGKDQLRILVTDRIGADGPPRTTTDLTLTRAK